MKRKAAQPTGSGQNDRALRQPRFRISRLLAIAGIALFLGPSGPGAAVAALHPMTVAVLATGSIPGIDDSDLLGFLASTMNTASDGTWRFAPAANKAVPPDRIEWSIKTNASAAGSVRTYGFSRATMQRLLGVHQFLTIEVTLYLHGQYQTQSLSQVTAIGGANDPDLIADLVKNTKQLMTWAATNTDDEPARSGP